MTDRRVLTRPSESPRAARTAPAATKHRQPRHERQQGRLPPGGPEDPESAVQRPPPAARAGQENPTSGESQDVFVALAGPEDETAVPQVVGEPRDHHHADDGTAREGRKQSDDKQNAGHQLRDARRPRVEKAGTHSEALEPPTGSGDLPASEDVVPSVSQENGTYSQAKDQQPHICGSLTAVLPQARASGSLLQDVHAAGRSDADHVRQPEPRDLDLACSGSPRRW